MTNILSQLLQKRGINDVNELSKEERVEFDNWNAILSKDEVSIEKIAEFCQSQIAIVERSFDDLERSPQKTDRLVLQHTIYSKFLNLISGPKHEREALEKYLQGLLTK
jgi:hypothetical protein